MPDVGVIELLRSISLPELAVIVAFQWWFIASLRSQMVALADRINDLKAQIESHSLILEALAPLARRDFYQPPVNPFPTSPRPIRERRRPRRSRSRK